MRLYKRGAQTYFEKIFGKRQLRLYSHKACAVPGRKVGVVPSQGRTMNFSSLVVPAAGNEYLPR